MTDGRTKRVTFYVDEDEREALKREADAAGKSLSSYVLQLVRRQRQLDAEEEVSDTLNVEQRLEQIANEAAEDMSEAAQAIEEQQRLSGKYSIALWELLKADYADPRRQQALETSHARLNKVIDMPPPDTDDENDGSDGTDENRDGKASSVDDLL